MIWHFVLRVRPRMFVFGWTFVKEVVHYFLGLLISVQIVVVFMLLLLHEVVVVIKNLLATQQIGGVTTTMRIAAISAHCTHYHNYQETN